MNTASRVYALEAENIPEFTNPEWFEVTGMNSYASQTEGTVVCKSGAKTGITCGQIVDADYPYGGTYGQPWIKVSKTYGLTFLSLEIVVALGSYIRVRLNE